MGRPAPATLAGLTLALTVVGGCAGPGARSGDDADVVPTAPVVTSNCGEVLVPVVTSSPKNDCEGDRNWYFTYTDCEGNTATWMP